MEEKSIINSSLLQLSSSNSKLRHNLYQTNRNYRQLENRISILELEKRKKFKDIQNKLNQHKKFVENKIYKYQLHSAINNRNNNEAERQNSNSRIFRAERESRSMNIRKQQDDLLMTKHKLYEETKQNRMQNQKKIMLQKLSNIQQKVKKRNRVRLIEIQSKENVENFWNSRLQSFQEDKKMEMNTKLKKQEEKLKGLQELQTNEENLLEQIRKAEQIESQLKKLIEAEKSMEGGKLINIYQNKFSENQ